MSEKCVHEWYYRIVDIVSWQFFCIRCGEKLSMDKFSDRATELEKNADALNTHIAELEAAQRWIPVSERLPEECTPVLTLSKDNDKPVTAFLDAGFWWSNVDWALNVTHWMPLPQPPEVQQ